MTNIMSVLLLSIILLQSTAYSTIGQPGPKGDKGSPGPPGPPGICLCDNPRSKSSKKSHKKTNTNPSQYISKNRVQSPLSGDTQTASLYNSQDARADTIFASDLDESNEIYLEKGQQNYLNDIKNNKQLRKDLNKENSKINSGYKGFNKEQQYDRIIVNNSDFTDQDYELNYTRKVNKKFRESVGDEGHTGSYKGSEFDFSNKFKNEEGLFVDNSIENRFDNERYGNFEDKIEAENEGMYYGDEYLTYGDDEEDRLFRSRNNVRGKDEGDGDGFGKDRRGGRYGGFERKRVENEKDKDYKVFGAGFDGKDRFKKSRAFDEANGEKVAAASKAGYNKAEYKNIDNKGYNKIADYEGDYNRRDKFHDLNEDVRFYEDLLQKDTFDGSLNGLDFDDGDPNVDIVNNQRFEERGSKIEGNFEAYNDIYKYNEKESINKGESDKYNKKRAEKDEYFDTDNDKDFNMFYDKSKENGKNKGKRQNNFRNVIDPRKRNRPKRRDSRRKRRGERRRLLMVDNENEYNIKGFNNKKINEIDALKRDICLLYYGLIGMFIMFLIQTFVFWFVNKN